MQEVVKVEEGVNVAEGKQQQEHIFASGTAGLPLHFLFFFLLLDAAVTLH